MIKNQPNYIPATEGYFTLQAYPEGDGIKVEKFPVIGWMFQQVGSHLAVMTIPVTINGSDIGGHIVMPNGSVYADGEHYDSISHWNDAEAWITIIPNHQQKEK